MSDAITAPRRIWAVHTVSMYGATSSWWRISASRKLRSVRYSSQPVVSRAIANKPKSAGASNRAMIASLTKPRIAPSPSPAASHMTPQATCWRRDDEGPTSHAARGRRRCVKALNAMLLRRPRTARAVAADARERVVVRAEGDELVHELRVRAPALFLGRQIDARPALGGGLRRIGLRHERGPDEERLARQTEAAAERRGALVGELQRVAPASGGAQDLGVCGGADRRRAEHEVAGTLRAQRRRRDREVALGDGADELVQIGAHGGRGVLHRVEVAAEPR